MRPPVFLNSTGEVRTSLSLKIRRRGDGRIIKEIAKILISDILIYDFGNIREVMED